LIQNRNHNFEEYQFSLEAGKSFRTTTFTDKIWAIRVAKTDALISLFVADDISVKGEGCLAQNPSGIIDIEGESDLAPKKT
jgi:hypothetical protein